MGLNFTEAGEFARGIHMQAPEEAPAEVGASHMGVDEADPDPNPTPAPAPPSQAAQWGAWVAAGEGGEAEAAAADDVDMAEAEAEEGAGAAEDTSLTRERLVGSGARPPDLLQTCGVFVEVNRLKAAVTGPRARASE